MAYAQKEQDIRQWLDAKHAGDRTAEVEARTQALVALNRVNTVRAEAAEVMQKDNPGVKSNDADYVFVTFILDHLPHGLIGLLMAAFFAAALQSKSAELNALGSTTTVDFYRHLLKREASDAHYVAASRWFTFFWGLVAITFALFANLVENLIQAVNIVGSVFYPVVLALFIVAFFLKRVGGTAIFWSALSAQILVLVMFFLHYRLPKLDFSYLWYNLIGCVVCVLLSLIIQAALGSNGKPAPTSPVS